MKKLLLPLLAVTALASAAPALAQAPGAHLYRVATPPWVTINDRQATLFARIDAGVRNHTISPAESASLRAQFHDIANMEAHYRATGGGLDDRERADLNARFDNLSARISQATSTPAGWVSIDQRQANLYSRIDQGVRNGALTRREAARLRTEFQSIARLEAHYRATGGLDARERADLNARFDRLSRGVFINKHDRQVRR